MRHTRYACAASLVIATAAFGQLATAPIQELPAFNAGISFGFNYDLLQIPTEVPYDYPRGYIGLNIPFEQNVPILDIARGAAPAIDKIFLDTTIMRGGEGYRPRTSARQNPNTTVRVDVPMMGGCASFLNTQNFFLNYRTTLGNPDLFFVPDSLGPGINLLMRGTINVPLELSMAWESMTLGYAYRPHKHVSFAVNLSRHIFSFNLSGSVNIDILGRLEYDAAVAAGADAGAEGFSAGVIGVDLNYPSERVKGVLRSDYQAEAWSPSAGVQLWRFTVTGRMGVDARAHGELLASYALPFFIDPETFAFTVPFDDPLAIADSLNRFMTNATDSIRFFTDSDLEWKMPHGVTIGFDIIPHKLTLSYTKTFGEVSMKLPNISTVRGPADLPDSMRTIHTGDLDIGVTVDHFIMLNANWEHLYFNLGVFTFDFREHRNGNLVGNAMREGLSWWPQLQDSPLIPVLNAGSSIGTKIQLVLELDVLPFPALKSGLRYYF